MKSNYVFFVNLVKVALNQVCAVQICYLGGGVSHKGEAQHYKYWALRAPVATNVIPGYEILTFVDRRQKTRTF